MRDSLKILYPGLAFLFLGLLSVSSYAQTRPKDGECRPDELDMGDYCASLPPARSQSENEQRRVTRFRAESMMPGKANTNSPGSAPAVDPKQVPAPVAPVDSDGFFVQIGAFSTRALAESVALSVESPGSPLVVFPLHRGNRVLWACTLGPFPDKASAEETRDWIRKDNRFGSAYVKAMDSEAKQGFANDKTQK
jgi:hypothetical protein